MRRMKKAELQAENLKLEDELRKMRKIEQQKTELQSENLKLEEELQKIQKLEQPIEQIRQLEIPENVPALCHTLDDLIYLLKANSWHAVYEAKEADTLANRYADAILAKYEQALFILETRFPTDPALPRYRQQLKTFRKNKFFGKYKKHILTVLGFIGLAAVALIASFLEKNK